MSSGLLLPLEAVEFCFIKSYETMHSVYLLCFQLQYTVVWGFSFERKCVLRQWESETLKKIINQPGRVCSCNQVSNFTFYFPLFLLDNSTFACFNTEYCESVSEESSKRFLNEIQDLCFRNYGTWKGPIINP